MKVVALFLLALFVATASSQTCGDGFCSTDFAENKVNCPADCEDICPCRPYCEGRECGGDGCGGSCGTCPFPRACNAVGRCDCDRNCIGKECGDDGCNSGDLCDFCGPLQTCGNDFLCRGECTPNCINGDGTRRECGNDGCFGSCGECVQVPGQDIRCRDGRCVCKPQCDMKECGSDGCGGDCGTCEGDAVCTDGFCVYPTLGCCGDGVCSSIDDEDVCSCPTDCPGCCQDGTCRPEFGETKDNCPDCFTDIAIFIRIRETEQAVTETCTVTITGPSSETISWVPTVYNWQVLDGGYGQYTFVTDCPSFLGESRSHTISSTTTEVILYVSLRPLLIEVRDGATDVLLNTASIEITAQFGNSASNGYNWNSPSLSWVPFSGFGSYQFVTSSSGYLTNTEFHSVDATTTLIVLYLYRNSVLIVVNQCGSSTVINDVSVTATSTSYSSFSSSLTVSGTSTSFTHVGFGSYTFESSKTDYETNTQTFSIDQSTTQINLCISRSDYCGDGRCSGDETASPGRSTSCIDCGRLRGVISLAVGQKDQLSNITISVWAHPENPAIRMRNNEDVPPPHFTTVSDSKGFFSIATLSFDGPEGFAEGSYSRRFYFSLTGTYTDRTGTNDQQSQLLPLWWNYELTNRLWSGSGSLVGTNNSPSLYFYMTPPFQPSDALVRVILSWGTLISNPSTSIPDLDLVVAGPVTQESITAFGTGVINFANKDSHSSNNNVLPYAKIITDSAQGFGPEVFDFYGAPGTTELGFSSSYASDAAANAYEIWVDRPNSSPNQDSISVRIADTNSFIVLYQAATSGLDNEQILFDARTGVEHAYGFYNTDQWNQVPAEASMWHIIDFSLAEGGIKFEGFPGGNDEQPGAKYSYAGGFFDATKQMPCGHVAARGANPSYCPATLTYPQTKK